MKIAIIGYGKMGRMVEAEALKRGHEICCIIDLDNRDDFASEAFRSADVAIEFSRPEAAVDNLLHAFAAGVPVVCGTTGWYASMPEISDMCRRGEGTLLAATNFSLGVNIFRMISKYATAILSRFREYTPSLSEVHHIHKLDHPSGTAITLAEELIALDPSLKGWKEVEADVAADADTLAISHERRGEVPGIHTITWNSDVDEIVLTHSAKSRAGFALGAVVAAEWLTKAPKGDVYSMDDVMDFLNK